MNRRYRIIEEVGTSDILAAIAEKKAEVFDNINDGRADFKTTRRITINIEFKPDPDTGSVAISANIATKLAPVSLMALTHAVQQIALEDIETGEIEGETEE